ncbi:MAG: site-specific DNA-methyltransferase [Coriobacteriales bacterium]|jgi:adenine-specific DNA-methyltransferase
MDEFVKLDLDSEDLVDDHISELKKIMPEVFSESGIDFDKLRLLLGDEVDEGDERYTFTWPGKADAIRQSQTSTSATLRPCIDKSRGRDGKDGSFDSDNIYIEGDNLEALKLLQRAYHGKVKLIYIDPPYNTGHNFVYKDSFGDSIANYKKQAGLSGQSNTDTSGRFHSDWCSMMYPRLKLARELLSDDGAIFISIDDNESANLRKICDEIFGTGCFVADISWQRNYSTRNDSKGIPAEVEHMLCYSRNSGWQPNRLERTAEMDAKYKNPDGDTQPWTSSDPFAPGAATHQGMVYAIQHPFTGNLIYPSNGRCWTFDQSQILKIMNGWCPYELRDIHDEQERAKVCGVAPGEVRKGVKAIMLAQGLEASRRQAGATLERGPWPHFYFTRNGNGGIRRKIYLDSVGGRLPTNLWKYEEVGHTDEAKKEVKALFNGSIPFDTPKPVRLMKRVLQVGSNGDSLVLDFFSGSATMADAIMRQNAFDGGSRKYILVQLPEPMSGEFDNLCEVGEERIRQAGREVIEEVGESNRQLKLGEDPKPIPDIGFRVFKLDESGIVNPKEGQLLIDRRKPDRSDLDIIFEVMIKWGYELTYPIEKAEYAGYTCYSVAAGDLICCMEPGLTIEALEAIASERPRRVFVMDSAFAGDDSLKLNALAIFNRVEEQTQHKIELRTV